MIMSTTRMSPAMVVVKKVHGKSRVTRCLSKYPLKFITPTKVGSSAIDAVWIYTATYGGGLVSGDSISCEIVVGDGCTACITTQASTKVYKSIDNKCSEQFLEAKVGSDALLVVIPDPVTCFSTAKYNQKQVFRVSPDANLVVVDWITSGRHESGERWDMDLYRSANCIFANDEQPIFLDSVLLEAGKGSGIAERMHHYQVMGMLVVYGRKLKQMQLEIEAKVRETMCGQMRGRRSTKPTHVTSYSPFGPKGTGAGVVVRFAAMSTEWACRFLGEALAGLGPVVGVRPYKM